MPYITVVEDSPAGSVENLEKLMTDILAAPDGLAARYAGMADGKLCIVAVWDSRAQAEDFLQHQLGPGLRRLLGPNAPAGPPRSTAIEVEHSYVR